MVIFRWEHVTFPPPAFQVGDTVRRQSGAVGIVTNASTDRLNRIERLVEKNAEAIARHEKELEKLESLFLQLSRDNLAIARTIIIITAGTVTILSSA